MINLRLASRSLLKTPLVTAAAVLSLALGIGANAAIFSLFEQMILKPLPVMAPDQLVNLSAPGPKPGSQSSNNAGDTESVFSYPMFRDLEGAETAFTGIAGHRSFGANLAYDGDTLSSEGMLVSGSYFEVLGLRPALGRLFSRQDDHTPGAHPLVVLSHSYWRTRFNGETSVEGETLTVNGQPLTIIGVAPRGFTGTTLGQAPQIFVPISMRDQMIPDWQGFDDRRSYWVYLFARLKAGSNIDQARAAINGPYQGIIRDVELPLQEGLSDRTLERFKQKAIELAPGQRGQSRLYEEVRAPLLLLLAVTAFVLLIACANIANLLLVRATNRAGEIAIRLSIGAQRHQVVGQLLAESFVLAAFGGLLGFVVARVTLRVMASLLPADSGLALRFELGAQVWLFLAVLWLVTGLVGLFPALHSTRHDLVASLKSQSGRGAVSRGANRFRASMVTLQIALSMALLISAGLFTKSLLNVSRVDLGIEVERVATFGVSPELNNYTPAEARLFFERLEDEVQALPGVESVAGSLVPLIAGSNWGSNVSVQGFDAGPDTDTHSNYNEIGPGFFQTLGIPLLAGREVERRDAIGEPKVALVNETFARKYHLGRDAVGKRMQVGSGGELDIEIIGLVQDAKYSEVKDAVPPLFYLPYRQNESLGAINYYVRTSGEPVDLLPVLRRTVAELDANLPVENLRTLALQVRENVFLDRMLTTLSAAFAILATILAAVGLYGVMAYTVAQRTREIGVRMALGADSGRVRQMILRQVGWLTLVGVVVGAVGALGLGKVASSLLFELESHDVGVFVLSIVVLASVALIAGLVPAQRASGIDPMRALRDE